MGEGQVKLRARICRLENDNYDRTTGCCAHHEVFAVKVYFTNKARKLLLLQLK